MTAQPELNKDDTGHANEAGDKPTRTQPSTQNQGSQGKLGVGEVASPGKSTLTGRPVPDGKS